MTPVAGAERLFEAHLIVADLDLSMAFYRDRLGLELAHVVPARRAAFFWIGSRGHSMLGLWQGGAGSVLDQAAPSRSISRSLNFWIFPDGVAGIASRTISRSGMYWTAIFWDFRNSTMEGRSMV